MTLTKLSILVMVALATLLALLFKPPLPQVSMLTDPFLQLPSPISVHVVWFTEWQGVDHYLLYGDNLAIKVRASNTRLSRTREDSQSFTTKSYSEVTPRAIWRHEAIATDLVPGAKLPYQVISIGTNKEAKSPIFTLGGTPSPGTPLQILLTSDHQLMPMTAANLQKVEETLGRVDAIFLAGDLVNIPDRASEWFDDSRGGAFFPCLQGRANYQLTRQERTTIYRGGQLIQHAPLFPALGNHEVMGRYSEITSLNQQFNQAYPKQAAQALDPTLTEGEKLKNNSFNTDTYEEIFTLPQSKVGGKKYYSVRFGDVWLGVLYATNIWRSPKTDPQIQGRYQESSEDLNFPERWGYGQHIFEPITPTSDQYQWLKAELATTEFQEAKYKIIMLHHPLHSLGGNIVPPYTDPVPELEYDEDGSLSSRRYHYPPQSDYLVTYLKPLLQEAGIDLVFYGHSHLWNRFYEPDTGINYLESSNVGNSYGAHWGSLHRPVPDSSPYDYAALGDPNGLDPVVPTLAPLQDDEGNSLPYIASNDLTVFSILDTSQATVSSYYFNTQDPDSAVIKFDEFTIGN